MTKREQDAKIKAFEDEINGVKNVRTPSNENDNIAIESISMRKNMKEIEVLNGKEAITILSGKLGDVKPGGYEEINGKDNQIVEGPEI